MTLKPPFEELVAKHSGEIFGYLWRTLRDPARAEDVYQETFLRAYEAYPRVEDPTHLRAWLYRIATNTANTHLTKQNREARRTTPLLEALPDQSPSVDDRVGSRLALAEVLRAVEKLPPKQRAALMLRKYQELSYREIGRALDSSADAARANVYLALRRLREQFGEPDVSP